MIILEKKEMAKTNPTNIQSAKWKIQTRGWKQQGVTLTGEELRAVILLIV